MAAASNLTMQIGLSLCRRISATDSPMPTRIEIGSLKPTGRLKLKFFKKIRQTAVIVKSVKMAYLGDAEAHAGIVVVVVIGGDTV